MLGGVSLAFRLLCISCAALYLAYHYCYLYSLVIMARGRRLYRCAACCMEEGMIDVALERGPLSLMFIVEWSGR